ncbi:putative T7SS-secreted protein [Actinomycetospora sp. NBC_00405]|uniref:putative T7SS-secreted protein n=1 Tax=Actinomycetospora sp. NBC_00405 TaxID=2975952 RepID=UPI002E217AFC
MAELGETADPAALLPGDPAGVRAVQATMARLGAALVGAGDGLRRIDTGDWQGEAADSFRRVFEPVPPLWTGTGEAFLEAADALAEYADVLERSRDEAATAVREWAADPVAAVDRLRAARVEVSAAGNRAAASVAHARDLAPPAPSVAEALGGFLGDLAGGAWSELAATGQFLWQVNPTRFLVEPATAAQGWQDLGTGVAHAVTHPAETVTAALAPREAATNPTRWAGEVLTGAGLSALGGVGAAGRIERATRAAGAVPAGAPGDGGDQAPPLGRYNGLTAAEHAANEGVLIGRPGSAKKMKVPTRELDTSEEVDEVYRALAEGGQVVQVNERRSVVLLEDGTYITWRPTAASTEGESAVDINAPVDQRLKVHTPMEANG